MEGKEPMEIQSPHSYPVTVLKSGDVLFRNDNNTPMDMEIESPDLNTENTPRAKKQKKLNLFPVTPSESGVGLPYAPENWPKPGDNWTWRVGTRKTVSGHFLDRYLYPPIGLTKSSKKISFKSKLSVEQYILSTFPDADINSFFASFTWHIPSDLSNVDKEKVNQNESMEVKSVKCKGGNKNCSSLIQTENIPSKFMSCDICCSEPNFCQHCSCILCCGTISSSDEAYSYIKCEAKVDGSYICGHVVHIDCGIRANLTGTVKGNVGLDAEYYCRRCDSRTDLISHVAKLLKTCKSTDSSDRIHKILTAGTRLLYGSKKPNALELLHHMKLAMAKVNKENEFEDIFVKEKEKEEVSGDLKYLPLTTKFDPRVEVLKIEDEIEEILVKLKKSQEYEYKVVKERLLEQKEYVESLYDELDKERLLTRRVLSNNSMDGVLKKLDKLKEEFIKLMDMKKVENGFGRASKPVVKQFFDEDF